MRLPQRATTALASAAAALRDAIDDGWGEKARGNHTTDNEELAKLLRLQIEFTHPPGEWARFRKAVTATWDELRSCSLDASRQILQCCMSKMCF